MRNAIRIKAVYKFTMVAVITLAITACCFSQSSSDQSPTVTPQNLLRGVTGSVNPSANWANYSAMTVIPGSALFPISSSTTVLYIGFVGGSTADVGNMVLYTTARGSLTITASTPVKLGGVSNPSINLTSTSVCPVQPPSSTNPCIVRLDPISLSLAPASDYYLILYFTNDANNQTLDAAASQPSASSLAGIYFSGDFTNLSVGQSLPGAANNAPDFLMYVMNN